MFSVHADLIVAIKAETFKHDSRTNRKLAHWSGVVSCHPVSSPAPRLYLEADWELPLNAALAQLFGPSQGSNINVLADLNERAKV